MVKTDCIYFPLDRPCSFHKEKGIFCPSCARYVPIGAKRKAGKEILVIKLDAMGDVLRTTFLLPGIFRKYGKARITWVVAESSVDILKGNPNIDEIWSYDKKIFDKLLSKKFDISINLDLSPSSLSLATLAVSAKKIGFWLDNARKIRSSNKFAEQWLLMSASDKHKKNNKESYQYWMSKIAGLPGHDYPIYVPLNKASKIKSDKFVSKYGLEGKTVVGINPGAGKRWKMKRWTTKGFVKLIDVLHKQGVRVLLLGGPEENEVINDIKHKTGGKAINTGTNNAIPDFFAILSLCDLVVTGDTMALHAALGLGKKAVAVFGPTSSSEIFMYGRGEKIAADIECACCYRPDCRVKPNCMETISFEKVWYAVKRQLGLI